MSLLSMVQRAMVTCGLDAPASAFANNDQTVQQFVTHLVMEGESLSRDYDWASLLVQATVTGDGTSTLFDMPADFDRWIPGRVFFKNDDTAELYRHVTNEQMDYLQASTVVPVWPVWRQFGSQFEFYPALPNGDVLRTQYVTSHWIINSDMTTRSLNFSVDTDTSLMPERLLILGAVWRWRKAKGFPFTDDLAIYQAEVQKAMGNENGRENLNMGEAMEWEDTYPSFKISAA